MHKIIAIGVAAAVLTAGCSGARTTTTPPTSPISTQSSQSSDQQLTFAQQTGTSPSGLADGLVFAARVIANGGSTGVSAIAGPIARATLPCLSTVNSSENSVASLALAPYVVSSGTADDTLVRSYTSGGGTVTGTSTIQGVSILSGLITATAVKAEATTSSAGGSVSSDGNGSQLAGLVVAGTPIAVTPAANTRVNLANLGYVVLNEQIAKGNGTSTGTMTVNMIHVVVTTANALSIPVNTNIIVASAHTSYTTPPLPLGANAQAYSLYATGLAVSAGVTSGPWAIATLPCDGNPNTDRLAAATTPVGSLGTMVNKTWLTSDSNSMSAHASSDTASVSLLGGLVAGNGLATSVSVSRSSGSSTTTHTGTFTFVSLSVGGQTISPGVAPNTTIPLAGLGSAVINEQNGSGGAWQVNAVHIRVTTVNTLGLPIGADIIVGHSSARLKAL